MSQHRIFEGVPFIAIQSMSTGQTLKSGKNTYSIIAMFYDNNAGFVLLTKRET